MFEKELSTLGRMATTVGPPLSDVLAEVSEMAEKVVTWKGDPGAWRYAACKYDPITHNRIGYLVSAEPGNLGNVVHELTHVAVHEAYNQDFVNYFSPNAQNLPAREYNQSGYPDHMILEERQRKYRDSVQNNERERRFDDLIAKANNASTRAVLGDARCHQLVNQFGYGKRNAHTEFDTVINQTFFWLYEWANPVTNRSNGGERWPGKLQRPVRNMADPRLRAEWQRPRSNAVGNMAEASLLNTDLFRTLSGEVAAAYQRRRIARLEQPARPRSNALGSMADAKAGK